MDNHNHQREYEVAVSAAAVDELLEKEWLLTNERGSYASGSVIGCNTRRYHGLLIASLHPPIERVVTVANILDALEIDGAVHELACFEFSDRLHPRGYELLQAFWIDTGAHFLYDINGVTVEKAVYLARREDVALVSYEVRGARGPVRLVLKPLVALRDFHSLQNSSTSLQMVEDDGVVTVAGLDPHGPAVHLQCRQARFERGPDWWYAMRYRQESRRGQHDYEDVWTAGIFTAELPGDSRVTLALQATRGLERPGLMSFDVEQFVTESRTHKSALVAAAQARTPEETLLVKAADQFVVRRAVAPGKKSTSILAGYHWFADWGRDTFIALPGLLLETSRTDQAREVLQTFGAVLDQGMIPNRFDDYGGPPHYNSVDASLWYINAAWLYRQNAPDDAAFDEQLRPVCAAIVAAYEKGTRFNIHADSDGLISAGDAHTQLTWMDAKCNDVVFTPRYGKAVEINALWINALHILAETAADDPQRKQYAQKARRAARSFKQLFWNDDLGCLNDCILPDGTVDAAVRPNQIFAVALPFTPLSQAQQRRVVKAVREHLLTPYGLRSLSPADSRYRGHYGGDQFQRDSAYHQGTVWAFLMEPFIAAHLAVHKNSRTAVREARKMIAPLLEHLRNDACLGSVSEIFDGDYPHRPKGCVAQAWSVAALLRCLRLIARADAATPAPAVTAAG